MIGKQELPPRHIKYSGYKTKVRENRRVIKTRQSRQNEEKEKNNKKHRRRTAKTPSTNKTLLQSYQPSY